MRVLLLLVGVTAFMRLRGSGAIHSDGNATNTSVDWGTFVADYCKNFCECKDVDAGMCTVCAQRLDTSVSEGHVACAVDCEGAQTDEITESVVACGPRLDKCMFQSVDPALCRLECSTSKSASCSADCMKNKVANHEAGDHTHTFIGKNYIETISHQNVTKEVDGENVTVKEEVVNRTVVPVEPLPVAELGDMVSPVPKLEHRYHSNESLWMQRAHDYCGNHYCDFAGVDSYLCVECKNRLNNTIEHGLFSCHVGCEMKKTDDFEGVCDTQCMHDIYDFGTCALECEAEKKSGAKCEKECVAIKTTQRGTGANTDEIRPFFETTTTPEPNVTSTNATEEVATEEAAPADEAAAEEAGDSNAAAIEEALAAAER